MPLTPGLQDSVWTSNPCSPSPAFSAPLFPRVAPTPTNLKTSDGTTAYGTAGHRGPPWVGRHKDTRLGSSEEDGDTVGTGRHPSSGLCQAPDSLALSLALQPHYFPEPPAANLAKETAQWFSLVNRYESRSIPARTQLPPGACTGDSPHPLNFLLFLKLYKASLYSFHSILDNKVLISLQW